MLFLYVVKLLMLSYICDVAVAVVAVMAEIHFIPSVVSGTSAEIAVQSVAVPVVYLKVYPFLQSGQIPSSAPCCLMRGGYTLLMRSEKCWLTRGRHTWSRV